MNQKQIEYIKKHNAKIDMENITNLTDNQLIKIGWEEGQPDTLCEVCADNEMITEASHYSHNTEMCYDCYSEVNE